MMQFEPLLEKILWSRGRRSRFGKRDGAQGTRAPGCPGRCKHGVLRPMEIRGSGVCGKHEMQNIEFSPVSPITTVDADRDLRCAIQGSKDQMSFDSLCTVNNYLPKFHWQDFVAVAVSSFGSFALVWATA